MVRKSLIQPFREFLQKEQASGILLIGCTLLSLSLANSQFRIIYNSFWQTMIGVHLGPIHLEESLLNWINDGLMTIFFLVAGLEIKRELLVGELSGWKRAALPFIAALGGMLVPALLYRAISNGTEVANGWGIPMATDIAFALGVLSLLGSRIPLGLKVFLTALAVIDDLGAVLVIAVFYSQQIQWEYLLAAFVVFGFLLTLNHFKVASILAYALPGILLWFFMKHSGVHATIAGVLIALAVPLKSKEGHSPLHLLEQDLHGLSAYFIMPFFALANTAIPFAAHWASSYTSTLGIAIIVGLVIGKPLGIFSFSWIAKKLGLVSWPNNTSYKRLLGIGFLGGIGFTMSIFITLLAFDNTEFQNEAKVVVLTASLAAGILGFFLLRKTKERQ